MPLDTSIPALVWEFLKALFFVTKKQLEKFSSTFNTSLQKCLCPLFQNRCSIFCCFIFFEECLNPQVRINKMVNEYTDDYHPSPLEFTSRIYFYILYFYGLLRGLSLWNISFFFFSNLYIPPRLQKSFKFMVLRLLENTFVSKESVYLCPQANLSSRFLSSPLQTEGNYLLPPDKVFWNSIFPSREWENYGAENMTKIELAWVLVTSFDKFHHFEPLHFWFLFCCAII